MSKNILHLTPSGKSSGYCHEGLVAYDATVAHASKIKVSNVYLLCIEGNPQKALAKKIGKLTLAYYNQHLTVIEDLVQNIFAAKLNLHPIFMEIAYVRTSLA